MATLDASRWRPLPVQPARSASWSMTSQPTLWRVPAYCEPGVPEPDDDLQPTLRGQHDRARSRLGRTDGRACRDGTPGGRAASRGRLPGMVAGCPSRLTASDRESRRSRARIRASSSGSAWSSPQMWSVPWVTRSRSSSAGTSGRRRSGRRGRPPACSTARSTETTMSPRWAGVRGQRDAHPGGTDRASNGNDSTSVGPVLPMWVALSPASSASSLRISPIEAGGTASSHRIQGRRRSARASEATDTGDATAGRTSTSIRQGGR